MEIINLSQLSIYGIKPKIIYFPDGEFKVVIKDLPKDRVYTIIVQTDKNPSENILATAMLIDIVQQNKPEKIVIIHPWLSFSRQDKRFLESEPLTIEILLKFYISLGVTDIISCDIHTVKFREPGVHTYQVDEKKISIHNLNVISSLYDEKFKSYLLVSPTGTDEPFLKPLRDRKIQITYFKKEKYCQLCNKPLQFCVCGDKSEPNFRITSDLDVYGKNIVIADDIIAGGGTMLSTVKEMKQSGAKDLKIIITHGFFNNIDKAKEMISLCSEIIVSNTVALPESIKQKVNIIDISNLIKDYLSEL